MILTVRDLIAARVGVSVTTRASAAGAVVGVAAARMMPQDPSRLGFILINLSANDIYLSPVGVPSATYGILAARNGGSVGLWCLEDGEVTAWEWQAIATAAGSGYFLMELLIAKMAQGT